MFLAVILGYTTVGTPSEVFLTLSCPLTRFEKLSEDHDALPCSSSSSLHLKVRLKQEILTIG